MWVEGLAVWPMGSKAMRKSYLKERRANHARLAHPYMQYKTAWASHRVVVVEEGLRLLALLSGSHLYEQWYSLHLHQR